MTQILHTSTVHKTTMRCRINGRVVINGGGGGGGGHGLNHDLISGGPNTLSHKIQ